MVPNYFATISTVALTLVTLDINPVQARPVTYDFTIVVTQGSLAGNTFNGSFTYDDEAITGVGEEEIGVDEGLTVIMNFFGQDYTETEDTAHPTFPKLLFEDGEIQRLDFWIESGKRGNWWDLPGWEVELSPRPTSESLL